MSDPITAETLAEWRALAEAATEGPWWHYGDLGHEVMAAVPAGEDEPHTTVSPLVTGEADAAFIAAARTAVPALIAEVQRLAAERDAWAAQSTANATAAYGDDGWKARAEKAEARLRVLLGGEQP